MTAQARTERNPQADGHRSRSRRSSSPDCSGQDQTSLLDSLSARQGLALALVAEALDRKQFRAAATSLVTELATAFGCERVSLGTRWNNRIRLAAISNSAEFEDSSGIAVAIADAMEEACRQESVLSYPVSDARFSTRAHAELAREHDDASILTIPLVGGRMIGALLLEKSSGERFDESTIEFAEQIALLLGPILHLKLRVERPLRQRLRASLSALLASVLGPRHLMVKTTAIVLASLTVLLLATDGTARITSSAALEPSETHAVVAPVSGFIESAQHRAGDVVTAGSRLASLDQSEMRLERSKWESELGKLGKEYGAALAARDRTQLRVLASQKNRVHAEMKLLDNMINRAHLVAPIDGVIVRGDLSEAYGSPVERGQLLFEVAPLEKYRVILRVDERDVAHVAPGQSGRLVLAGRPDEPIGFTVKRIMPVSQAEKGINAFRVEAELETDPTWVRPGMEGAAKVDVGRRSLAWIYTHRLIDALRLRWWKLGF